MLAGLHRETPRVVVDAPTEMGEVLARQCQAIQARRFRVLGNLRIIELDTGSLGRHATRKVDNRTDGIGMDWGNLGPDVGVIFQPGGSKKEMVSDGDSLVFTSLVPNLPKLPDPNWDPASGEAQRMISQHWKYNASGTFLDFVVYRPVLQAILRAKEGGRWLDIRFSTGMDGRQTALLVNPFTNVGHIVGGRFEMFFRG